MKKEQTAIISMKDSFAAENMQSQYTVLNYTIDLYFDQQKFAMKSMN